MAKKENVKRKGGKLFRIILSVYTILALTGIFFGLKWFWGFMEAYEASQPYVAVDAYKENLSREHIVAQCAGLLDEVDLNIQSEDECMAHLFDAVRGEITYARKTSACTETQQTYILRCGEQVIGSFVIEAGDADQYGFTPWHFKEESFDLSFLMGTETISVTVPGVCDVHVNGVKLDETYITAREVREFEILEEFYVRSHVLPIWELVTYEAGPFLNARFEMEVFDPEGKPFTMDENFDENSIIALGDEQKLRELEDFLEEFIDLYVAFAGCAGDDHMDQFNRVIPCVVPESDLAKRMQAALDDLPYAQTKADGVTGIVVNHCLALADDEYMCDVTYEVNTIGTEGTVKTTINAKLLIVKTDGKLLVESMIGY